ncbi:MAG TPA: class I adenylate-forming enzyme family protein [Candidatus Binatia bacterium]
MMLFLDHLARNRRERGDHPYLVHEGRSVTFEEFDRLTNRAAHALRALGVEKGDRVTLALGNSIEWLVAAFGALKAGGILNPVNPQLGTRELSYVIGHAEPRVLLTAAGATGNVTSPETKLPATTRLASFGEVAGAERFDTLLDASSDDEVPVRLESGDGSTLLYTSGTTGNPKGVLFTHDRTGGSSEFFVSGMRLGADDVILAVGPLFHGNAWSGAATAQQAGCTFAFPRAFSASEFWPLAHATGATAFFTLGTILAILLAQEPSELERTSKIRVVLGLGSAPIRDRVKERFRIPHVIECFGSTDAGVVTLEPLDAAPRPGSAGPPVPGVKLHILDDDGRELGPRQTGEIAVESPYRMACYFRDEEQTRRALRGDWFLSGDLGYLDEDGWLYFVDRKRDVIRRGGENISSVLVEKVLREHPQVAEVAVVGVHHPVLGQEVKAFIVPRGEVSTDDLRAFAAARLAKFQVPTQWEFRDSLPKTPTQRVEKYKLRGEAPGGGRLLG